MPEALHNDFKVSESHPFLSTARFYSGRTSQNDLGHTTFVSQTPQAPFLGLLYDICPSFSSLKLIRSRSKLPRRDL